MKTNFRKALLVLVLVFSCLLSSCKKGSGDFIGGVDGFLNGKDAVSAETCRLAGGHHDSRGICVKN